MKTIHLTSDMVPAEWRNAFGYTGRQFKAQITDRFTICDTDLQTTGSTCYQFALVNVHGMHILSPVKTWPAVGERKIELLPGTVLLQHTVFSAEDLGITIYACAADVHPALLDPKGLSDAEKTVLYATGAFKANYLRLDRLNEEMLLRSLLVISASELYFAKNILIKRGFLTLQGAITAKGKNVLVDITT